MEAPIDPIVTSPRMEIGTAEPLGEALQRVMLEQIAIGRDGFTLPADETILDSKVHLARKAFKRTRAILRLVRPEIGDSVFRKSNDTVRDQARLLSELRTARVLVGTLETFAAANPAALPAGVADSLRSKLLARRTELANDLRADSARIAAALENLDTVCERIDSWQLGEDFVTFAPGVRRIYRRGRKALETARQSGTVHAVHDWRKRVNYLRYQLEALSGRFPPQVAAMEVELDLLSETLGDEHDMADLAATLGNEYELIPSPALRRDLQNMLEIDRTGLQVTALEMGTELYDRKPGRFVALLAGYWDAQDAS